MRGIWYNGRCIAAGSDDSGVPPDVYLTIDSLNEGPRNLTILGSVRAMVLALVSVPIWLLIILLSPLDAYVVAKTISRQV